MFDNDPDLNDNITAYSNCSNFQHGSRRLYPVWKYYNEPILWRVINIDKDGDPLLFSEHILCLKAFDSAGAYHPDQGDNFDDERIRIR
jgi:hypothetical protein